MRESRHARLAASPPEPLVLDGLTDLARPPHAALEPLGTRPASSGATGWRLHAASLLGWLSRGLARLRALPPGIASPR
ncbi:hypothetical protein [Thiomonas sp. FB-6]|uniref:hypothetical protein n=1 Tax=Thiomonas sp. FB-6 TaxID=1158291 RepID=UPI00037A411A|nr:hypothetical protein [Thiomonas sp. FB-6]